MSRSGDPGNIEPCYWRGLHQEKKECPQCGPPTDLCLRLRLEQGLHQEQGLLQRQHQSRPHGPPLDFRLRLLRLRLRLRLLSLRLRLKLRRKHRLSRELLPVPLLHAAPLALLLLRVAEFGRALCWLGLGLYHEKEDCPHAATGSPADLGFRVGVGQ